MKKKLWIALAAALVFCAGCHGRAPLEETETGQEEIQTGQEEMAQEESAEDSQDDSQETAPPGEADLTVWLGNDLKSLDPAQALYDMEKTMLRHEYETLLVRNEDGEAKPGQAESWEVSEDGLTVTFHLRDDLKWSDGSSLTADDFIYSWNRLADPTAPSPYAEDLLGGVKGFSEKQEDENKSLALSAPDAQTLVVTLTAPDYSFPERCTVPAMSPVKKEVAESGEDDWHLSLETAVCNGAMVLSEYASGDHITFVKNENYWNAGQVSLNSLTFLLNGDEEENLARYQEGQLDLLLGGVDWQGGEEIPADQFSAPLAASSYVIINTEIEPFQDPRVRQAMSLVLDREYIADVVMEGSAEPAWTLIGSGYSDAEEGSSFAEISLETYFPDAVPSGSDSEQSSGSAPGSESAQSSESFSGSDSVEDTEPASDTAEGGNAELPGGVGEGEGKGGEGEGGEAEDSETEGSEAENLQLADDPLSQAQALLAEAGYPDGQGIPEIEYLINDNGYHLDLAEYLQSAWGSLGLSVKIREVTWHYFTPYRHAGEFTAARGTWLSDQNDPIGLLSQFASDEENNDGHYANRQVDGLLSAAREAESREAYYEALHQAEQLILEDGAAIPIAFYQDGWRQNPELYGVIHCGDGTWIFSYSYYL